MKSSAASYILAVYLEQLLWCDYVCKLFFGGIGGAEEQNLQKILAWLDS